MRIAVVRYPGSNCDFDTLKYFGEATGVETSFIWHENLAPEEEWPDQLAAVDLLIIPGGFAFGDRVYDKATESYTISPGEMALRSPVTGLIRKAAELAVPILGICNGFQILTKLGLLPGRLELNANKQFTCKRVACKLLGADAESETPVSLYIANSYGRYVADEGGEAPARGEVFLRYDDCPEIGAWNNVAGVCNAERTVFGMMPHPERNNTDFKYELYRLLFSGKNNDPRAGRPSLYYPHMSIEPAVFEQQLRFKQSVANLMESEHISYKSSKKYLRKMFTRGERVIKGPGENAGIVDIGGPHNEYALAVRMESHNHPTFIDPFEGAATGVGGILRDIFTMGARPIALLDFLRFGNDANSERLMTEAIRGISYYGNCIGVPNVGGDLYRNPTYNKNPLVNVACVGLVKKKQVIYGNALNNESLLIYVGSKTGNEGINGAAMASQAFTIQSDDELSSMRSNVQKSDPFLEKLLLEACCELAEEGLAEGMQDMGAGGLLCASYEVISRGRAITTTNLGCDMFIGDIPTKYPMEPCNVLISESQERMLIVCRPVNKDKIFEIFRKWDLEHAVVGVVNTSGEYNVYSGQGPHGPQGGEGEGNGEGVDSGDLLYRTYMETFANVQEHWPKTELPAASAVTYTPTDKVKNKQLWEIYDSTVGGRTIKGPESDGSYALLDLPEIKGQLAITWGESFDECFDQMRTLEATAVCMINCLNFGHPADSIGAFAQVVEDVTARCKQEKIPIVGGNVSLYNSSDNVSIKPTPIFVMFGTL